MIPLYDRNPTQRMPWVTIVLLLVNVAVFVLVQQAGTDQVSQVELTYERAAIPCELSHQRPITIGELRTDTCSDRLAARSRAVFPGKQVVLAVVVSMFLHASWLHLLGNMLFLWIFGNNVEDRLGRLRYLGFYLVGGAAATLAQVAIDPGATAPVIGASGAIAAVMGAYLVWYPRTPILSLIGVFPVPLPAFALLGYWFVSQFFTADSSGVAWMAHVGGFVFGMAVAVLWNQSRRRPVALSR